MRKPIRCQEMKNAVSVQQASDTNRECQRTPEAISLRGTRSANHKPISDTSANRIVPA